MIAFALFLVLTRLSHATLWSFGSFKTDDACIPENFIITVKHSVLRTNNTWDNYYCHYDKFSNWFFFSCFGKIPVRGSWTFDGELSVLLFSSRLEKTWPLVLYRLHMQMGAPQDTLQKLWRYHSVLSLRSFLNSVGRSFCEDNHVATKWTVNTAELLSRW